MSSVFNINKTPEDYQEARPPLFFGHEPGLFDTLNKPYPKIWSLYKEMKSLDWDELEFDYSQCNVDFKTCPKSVYDMMIRTLAWQWEADSVASRAIAPLLAPFITDSSLWAAWQRVSDNESIHAATYSEIVRMSFDDPKKVLKDILDVKESIHRMSTVNRVFAELADASHKYALGQISSDEAYDALFMAVVALFFLERVQFCGSFYVTFTVCSTNVFQPIGKAVQKIAQDELEVHAELDREVLRIEMATERGRKTYQKLKPKIQALADEVLAVEFEWLDYLFSEGRELVGGNLATAKQWVLFNARDPYTFLNLESSYKFPKSNPAHHMDNWINIGKTQAAPQEQDNNAYKVNTIIRDDANVEFDVDF